ncbi:DddA-like double-stranded DNA deaminase toxin [Actinokineospora sp.]|uniref:DddA-like double-stranded DNA deaminase toxin n=1 Tax=Actinokineospora sp. TaxID=1872133 RepID=UPI004037D7A9
MIGHVECDGRAFGTISATKTDPWSADVVQRANSLGLHGAASRLYNHVEMKAVAAMVQIGARRARIIMNHAPCGSEPRASVGCDSILANFIPTGSSLTILGTDAHGNPFQRTYEGRAAH